jgi:hypothetical protein
LHLNALKNEIQQWNSKVAAMIVCVVKISILSTGMAPLNMLLGFAPIYSLVVFLSKLDIAEQFSTHISLITVLLQVQAKYLICD